MIFLQVRIEAHPRSAGSSCHALLQWAETVRRHPELASCRLYEDLEEAGFSPW